MTRGILVRREMVDAMRRGRRMCDGRRVRLRGFASAAIAFAIMIAVGLGAAPAHAADGAAAGSAAGVTSDVAIDRARDQVLDADYQTELPGYGSDAVAGSAVVPGLPGRRAGGELDAERERRDRFDTRDHGEGGGSSLMTIVMWGLVVVIALLLALWLASELSRYGGDAELPPEAEAQDRMRAASAAIIDRPLGDADELAQRGLVRRGDPHAAVAHAAGAGAQRRGARRAGDDEPRDPRPRAAARRRARRARRADHRGRDHALRRRAGQRRTTTCAAASSSTCSRRRFAAAGQRGRHSRHDRRRCRALR